MNREAREGAAPHDPAGPRWGAFSYASYRWYWISNVFRVFGLQFRFIGVGWLVVSPEGLHASPVWLGIVGLATALPTIVLSVPAGIVADRYDNKRILVWSQAWTAIVTFALAIAILGGAVTLWMVLLWAVVTGALAALQSPAQSAILPRLIEMRSTASAVALTSAVWNTMRIIGPALAGVLIAVIGTGQAFFVTAAGFALSALLLVLLRLAPVDQDAASRDSGMLEGIRYVAREPVFLATIGLSFFTSVFGASYQVLLPVFSNDVLHRGSYGFGFMEMAAGIGSLLGTLAIIRVGMSRRAGSVMIGAAAVFGLCIAGFAASRALPLAMALLFCGGFAASMYLNIGMTALQVLVPDELRGRVMGVWSMTYFLAALGGLPASALAELVGTPWAIAAGALSVTAFALAIFIASPSLRRLPPLHIEGGGRRSAYARG